MAGPGGIPAGGSTGATSALTGLTGGTRTGGSGSDGGTGRPTGSAAIGASLIERATGGIAEQSTQSVLANVTKLGRQGGGDRPDIPDGAESEGGGSPSIVPSSGSGDDVDLPDGALGRQGGGSAVDPDDDGSSPDQPGLIFGRQGGGRSEDADGGPEGGDGPDGALARAAAAVREAGDVGRTDEPDPATELITATADAAGVEYDEGDLDDPKYRNELEEINRRLESNPDLAEHAQNWVVGLLEDGASLGQVIEELIRWLDGIAGRQGGG